MTEFENQRIDEFSASRLRKKGQVTLFGCVVSKRTTSGGKSDLSPFFATLELS